MRRLLSFATRGIMGQVLALAFVLLLFGIGTRGFFLSPKNLSTIYLMQRYTELGRNIIYIGANERMSCLSGLLIARARTLSFALSGFGAAVAGIILSATLYSGYPTSGAVYVLNSIAVVVVGGTAMTGGSGGVVNTLVGALIAVAITFDRKKVATIK